MKLPCVLAQWLQTYNDYAAYHVACLIGDTVLRDGDQYTYKAVTLVNPAGLILKTVDIDQSTKVVDCTPEGHTLYRVGQYTTPLNPASFLWNQVKDGDQLALVLREFEGAQIYTLDMKKDISTFCWSPDGSMMACGLYSEAIQIWDITRHTCIITLQTATYWITAIHWNPIQNLLVSGAVNGTVRIWNTTTWRCVHVLEAHHGHVSSAQWNPAGTHLASASHDLTIRIWDTTGTCTAILRGHSSWIAVAIWHPWKNWVVSGGSCDKIRIWDISKETCIKTLPMDEYVTSLSWHSSGKWLACGCMDTIIRIWDTANYTLGPHCTHPIVHDFVTPQTNVCWHPSRKWIASASYGTMVHTWTTNATHTTNVGNCGDTPHLNKMHKDNYGATTLMWSRCGKYLACANQKGITVWK